MAAKQLKKYNLEGQEIGHLSVDQHLIDAEANGQMIKDYIVAIRENARQWSASTKGRSEVNHTTKKPHPQKGGGRARQGMLSAPQYRGGGRVFGPKPKFDQHVRINKKEKRIAIRYLISEKIKAGRVLILDEANLERPKTKIIATFLRERDLKKRVLFIGEASYFDFTTEEGDQFRIERSSGKYVNLAKSLRNIPKTKFLLAKNVNGYDLMCAHDIVITEAAYQELSEWLS